MILAVLSGLASGGLLGAIATFYGVRKKAPAERDSIIVNSAETAVVALQAVLKAETRRADRAEARADELAAAGARKDQRIEALESRLDAMQAALDEAREELRAILASTQNP